MIRTIPETGVVERPWRDRDHNFVLGDPKHGPDRHRKENAILVDNYSEALELVRQGHLIRMSDGSGSASLVASGSIEIIDRPTARIDELWTYTVPETPFTLDQVLADLRRHLLSQAADLRWIAAEHAADEFIGFEFDADYDAESEAAAAKIDLERFNITRIARAAYFTAFGTSAQSPLSDEDADELELILGASLTRFGRRYFSPLENENSPLFRTLMAAYFRWQIGDGCFLGAKTLDQSAMTALTVLTGMPSSAVRNSLSKEGISTVRGKLDYSALLNWLEARRSFVPLREGEKPNARWTWAMAHLMKTQTWPDAFDLIRRSGPKSVVGCVDLEAKLIDQQAAAAAISLADLREYARQSGALPDTLVWALYPHFTLR